MMRDGPTWRIPVGVLALVAGLVAYAIAVATFLPIAAALLVNGEWPDHSR